MNKNDLIAAVAMASGTTNRDAESVLNSFRDVVQASVFSGDDISYPGLGKFSRAQRNARTARNPRTGETLQVAASRVPRFVPAAEFKRVVNGDVPAPRLPH